MFATKSEHEDSERRNVVQNLPEDQKEDVVDRLRVISRRKYLEEREKKKILELEEEILDDRYIFDGQSLTLAEKQELELKVKLLETAKKRSNIEDDYIDNGYQIPEDEFDERKLDKKKRWKN